MISRRILCLISVFVFALGLVAGVGVAAAAKGKDLVIGYASPLTGRAAKYGASQKRGAAMAIDEINAKGGVNGVKLKLVWEDSKCIPVEGVNAAERLVVKHKVDILMGETCSSTTLAMLKVIEEHKIPLVVQTSTAPAITACNAPTKGYVFRIVPTNDLLAEQLAAYILDKKKLKKIAAVTDVSNDWSVTLRDAFVKEAKKRGIKLIASESVQGRETDFFAVLNKVKAKRPEALFVNVMIDQGPPMVRQAHEIGLRTQLFSAQGLSTPDMERGAGKEAEGMVALAFYHPSNPDALSKKFTRAFAKRYSGKQADHYDVQPYDAIFVIADALKRAGGDKSKLRQALKETNNFKGVLSNISFDECGQAPGKMMKIQFRGGKMVPMVE
tara:strand:- start:65 stop:1216 length:1152 start_codon:yes stop_codon:yes gene_type:complete